MSTTSNQSLLDIIGDALHTRHADTHSPHDGATDFEVWPSMDDVHGLDMVITDAHDEKFLIGLLDDLLGPGQVQESHSLRLHSWLTQGRQVRLKASSQTLIITIDAVPDTQPPQ